MNMSSRSTQQQTVTPGELTLDQFAAAIEAKKVELQAKLTECDELKDLYDRINARQPIYNQLDELHIVMIHIFRFRGIGL